MPEMRAIILAKLERIHNLPTLPIVMTKLSTALEDVNCSINEIAKVLSNDPAISTQILKTVNSPLFAIGGSKVTTLHTAITRLGFREVKNIALSTSVFKMFDGVKSTLFDRKSFWKHCLCVSLASLELGALMRDKRRFPKDELHLAGLIHDIGKIILDAHFADVFEDALKLAMTAKLPLYEAERLILGIDHAELGHLIAEKWNLPPIANAAITYHHEPENAPEEFRSIVNIVHMANYIVNTQDLGTGGDLAAPVFKRQVLEALDLNAVDVQSVVKSVAEKEKDLSSSMF